MKRPPAAAIAAKFSAFSDHGTKRIATGPVEAGLKVMNKQANEPKAAKPSAARIHANPMIRIRNGLVIDDQYFQQVKADAEDIARKTSNRQFPQPLRTRRKSFYSVVQVVSRVEFEGRLKPMLALARFSAM
jgi:hypothetical protein